MKSFVQYCVMFNLAEIKKVSGQQIIFSNQIPNVYKQLKLFKSILHLESFTAQGISVIIFTFKLYIRSILIWKTMTLQTSTLRRLQLRFNIESKSLLIIIPGASFVHVGAKEFSIKNIIYQMFLM